MVKNQVTSLVIPAYRATICLLSVFNRGRLLLRTPGPVPFGTNVETILSWTCHVYGPYEFRTSLGTSIFASLYLNDIESFLGKNNIKGDECVSTELEESLNKRLSKLSCRMQMWNVDKCSVNKYLRNNTDSPMNFWTIFSNPIENMDSYMPEGRGGLRLWKNVWIMF